MELLLVLVALISATMAGYHIATAVWIIALIGGFLIS